MKTEESIFIQGAIPAEFVGKLIAEHQFQTNIGAYDIFLGQVRADEIEGRTVSAISYTAYEAMANKKAKEIKQRAEEHHGLSSLCIYHSLDAVKAGEICLLVFASAPHRKQVFEGLRQAVEEIKAELPVFGKELWTDETESWKVNQ
jgi:molybdopterin synthase catalytic subunit